MKLRAGVLCSSLVAIACGGGGPGSPFTTGTDSSESAEDSAGDMGETSGAESDTNSTAGDGDTGDGDGSTGDGDGSTGDGDGSAGDGDGDGTSGGDGDGDGCAACPGTPGMVCVPCGTFTRGSTTGEADEAPSFNIELSTFEIDRYEVTAGAYQLCVDDGVCDPPNTTWAQCNTWPPPAVMLDHPVNCVDWDRANDYCLWQGRRLPTEAEWEKAARGDDGRTYPWGESAPTCLEVSMLGPSAIHGCDTGTVEPVGTHSPEGDSPWGASDMSGNVMEWTNDYYSAGYYAVAPFEDPQGPPSGGFRSARGGSAEMMDPGEFRTAKRTIRNPDTTDWDLGFRCARTP